MVEQLADAPKRAWGQVRAWLVAAPKGALAELACRLGFVSRGAVYVTLGGVAVLAALHRTPRAEGPVEALQAWAEWPAGALVLWLIGIGLFGFAGWRVLQAVFDADRQGTRPAALAVRAGQGLSALVHVGLGFGVLTLIDTLSEFREPDDAAGAKAAVGEALAWPGGEWAVIGAGLFVVGVGIGNLVQAAGRPEKHLICDRAVRRAAGVIGRIGHLGRGIAFLPLGMALVEAGRRASTGPAEGLGGALEALGEGPFGAPMLALTGAGLVAFGLFAWIEARWRRLGAAQVVEELAAPQPA